MAPQERGQGFEFRASMAIGVIGGVITSMFLTLLVVPLLFALMEKITPKALRTKVGEPEAAHTDQTSAPEASS